MRLFFSEYLLDYILYANIAAEIYMTLGVKQY
jgi:hypothetical protein